MKTKKTKRLHIRLTEEEYTEIKKRAERFQSVTQYVLSAISDFSDSTVHDRMIAIKLLSEYYVNTEKHLAHIGGNLNQAMRRVNEAAKVAHPTQAMILTDLMPEIRQCHTVCTDLRKELMNFTKETIK